MCNFLWLKVSSNFQLIFCHESNLVSRVSFSSHIGWQHEQALYKVCFFLYCKSHSLIWTNLQIPVDLSSLRAPLRETQSEVKLVWNLKLLWNVVPVTWQFTWRFHCGNFLNNRKTLLHMCKWYILINANLINAKQMLRYWLFFKQ